MNDGMLIKLERFKFKDQKPRIRHASFTVNVSGRLGSRIFFKAIESEYQLYIKHFRKKNRESNN